MKIRTGVLFMVICLLGGGLAGAYLNRPKEQEPVTVVEYVVDNSAAIKRLKISETLVESMEREQKLIVLETELSEDITVDESFADWDVFKKMQMITVKATGKFTVDLGRVTQEDIIFDQYANRVVIRLPEPEVDSLTINEDQTVFHSVERGLLRFGEIKLTTAEQNELYKQAKQAMYPTLELGMKDTAKENARESVTGLAVKLLYAAGIDDFGIEIVWQ